VKIDIHTQNAVTVCEHEYFIVGEASKNEVTGLLVGTPVKKVQEPQASPSKYWKGDYWSVMVECPNGETRTVGCDALKPLVGCTAENAFRLQREAFNIVLTSAGISV